MRNSEHKEFKMMINGFKIVADISEKHFFYKKKSNFTEILFLHACPKKNNSVNCIICTTTIQQNRSDLWAVDSQFHIGNVMLGRTTKWNFFV